MGSAVVRARACSFAWHVSLVGGGTLQVKGARVSRNALIASLCLPNSTSHLSLSQTQTNTVDNHMLVLCLLLNHLPWMTPVSPLGPENPRSRPAPNSARAASRVSWERFARRSTPTAPASSTRSPGLGPRFRGRVSVTSRVKGEAKGGSVKPASFFVWGGALSKRTIHVEKCKDTLSL